MELKINHQKKVFDQPPSSLEGLMQLEAPRMSKGVAVAVNNEVIPKEQWSSRLLQENDSVLIITATQGG